MEIGLVDLMDGSPERDLAFMRRFAQTAENCGFSGIWLPEHVLFFEHYTSAYPYPQAPDPDQPEQVHTHNASVDGTPQVEAAAEQGLLDILQAASALCRATTTLRVGSSVLLLPLRNVRVFARELASVVALTGDRFDLGCGVGWSAEEFAACGVDFELRGRLCEANLRELRSIWADGSGASNAWLPDDAPALPRMLYGGNSGAAIRRAATVASGWYPWNLTATDFAVGHERFLAAVESAGRRREEYHVVAGVRFGGHPDRLASLVAAYERAGADGVNVSLRMTTDDYEPTMRAVSAALGLGA